MIITTIFLNLDSQVISVGDKFCDMSMSSKLKKYSELIKGAA